MFYYSRSKLFRDEIEDGNDLAQMLCALLTSSSAKDELWDIFDSLLDEDAFDGVKNVRKHWIDEQEEDDTDE
jgi:hypothetical protein